MIRLTRRTFKQEPSELSRIAVVSSGDTEKDQQAIRDAHLHALRITDGFCPNNCGPLVWKGSREAACEICDFRYHTNSPIEEWNKTHRFRSMEHPETGGIDAKIGDVEWSLEIELQHEYRLIVRMGAKDYEALKQIILASAEDDAREVL